MTSPQTNPDDPEPLQEQQHNFTCLECGHESSNFRSFQNHLKQHPDAEPPDYE